VRTHDADRYVFLPRLFSSGREVDALRLSRTDPINSRLLTTTFSLAAEGSYGSFKVTSSLGLEASKESSSNRKDFRCKPLGRMFANGPGTHSALRTSQVPESAANQLKGCRSNQMQSATKPASAVLFFTTYLTAGSAQLKTSRCRRQLQHIAAHFLPRHQSRPGRHSAFRPNFKLPSAIQQPC
jgi:hypothetical protein